MLMMTAKVNKKKLLLGLAVLAAAIVAVILLFGGKDAPTSVSTVKNNDDRVRFLESYGWDVATSPTESCQVRIPSGSSEVFQRYNALQKTMGYDLSEYAGQTVMRYVYKVKNYPGASEPVYATILIANNQVIGGDITDTGPGGKIQGFKMPEPPTPAAT